MYTSVYLSCCTCWSSFSLQLTSSEPMFLLWPLLQQTAVCRCDLTMLPPQAAPFTSSPTLPLGSTESQCKPAQPVWSARELIFSGANLTNGGPELGSKSSSLVVSENSEAHRSLEEPQQD